MEDTAIQASAIKERSIADQESEDIINFESFFNDCRTLIAPANPNPREKLEPSLDEIHQFERFLAEFKRMEANRPIQAPGRQPDYIERHSQFFTEFATVHEEMKKSGANFNIFNLTGIGYYELHCTQILAWFLDCHAAHGQGKIFLEKIVELIPEQYWHNGTRPDQLEYYALRTESRYDEDYSRLDVEIDGGNFYLIIEAKIRSCEGWKQLERYGEIAKRVARRRPWAVVYLTLGGWPGSWPKACPLSWKDMAGAMKKALEEKTRLSPLSPAHIVCTHFCEYIERL